MENAPVTPLIRFLTLGATDLRDPTGNEVLGVLTQPKRLALLAYLAIARPVGFHRRDTLLALFWPELDLAHARDALNQSIRHLRAELGPDVVVSRGATNVGVDEKRLWCDAVAFRSAIAAHQPERALELYQGVLLDGFFASGASAEFEQWLENERATLANTYTDALELLAVDATARGDHIAAVRHLRALGAAAPLNGRVACRLMEALAAAGDRDSALEVAVRYAARVRSELDAEPDPGVTALASKLRGRSPIHAASVRSERRAIAPAGATTDTTSLPSTEDRFAKAKALIGTLHANDTTPASRQRAGKRALIGGTVGAAVLVVWLVVQSDATPTSSSADSKPDSSLVAVAPFDVLSKQHELWGEGLMDLLSSELEGAGPLRTVSPSIVVRNWLGRGDRPSATAMSRATGAGLVLYGNVVATGGDSVRVTSRLLDVGSGVVSEIEVRDLGARLDRVADSVAVRVLRELGRTRPIAAVPSAGFGSASLPALKAYLAGEKFYRLVNRDSAALYYARAVSLDTSFALAWWKMARVRSLGVPEREDTVSIYGLRAGALNHGLSPRDSLLVLAESLYAVGQSEWGSDKLRRLHATLLEATRRFPNDPEIWFQVGRTRVYAPVIGNTARETLDAIDRAMGLDSAFAPAVDWVPPVKLALRLDSIAAARRYLVAGSVWEPKERKDGLRLAELMLANPRAGLRLLRHWKDTASTQAISAAAHALVDWPDSAESAVQLRRALIARAANTPDTSLMDELRWDLSYALARRGHLRDAFSMNQGRPWIFFSQAALLGGIPAESVALRSRRQPLAFLAWFAQQRDTSALLSAVGTLDSLAQRNPHHVPPPTAGWDLARGRAYLALARGDTSEAIHRFIPVIDSLCPGCSFSRTYADIYSAAPLLWSRGLDEKGEVWLDYDNITVPRPVFDVWFALARGRVAERLGNRAKAAAAYRFVVASWERGDAALQTHVREARTALNRLAGVASVAPSNRSGRGTASRTAP